jgi:protein-disulfide isomerase
MNRTTLLIVIIVLVVLSSLEGFAIYIQRGVIDQLQVGRKVTVPPKSFDMRFSHSHLLGSDQARIVLLEFSDYQCPFCSRYATEVLPELRRRYVDTGRVQYAFRNFPLSIHDKAIHLAELAECADQQGVYWKMHDVLFRNRGATDEALNSLYSRFGMDMIHFRACIASAPSLDDDIVDGTRAGVSGTPTFLLGAVVAPGMMHVSKILRGALSIDAFSKEIDALQ